MQAAFDQWLIEALPDSTPGGVVAYAFNLAEDPTEYVVELIGASSFDHEDSDWACDEQWTSRPATFEFNRDSTGDWMAALDLTKSFILSFMSSHTTILQQSQAVAVGFVDGDLSVIWTFDA